MRTRRKMCFKLLIVVGYSPKNGIKFINLVNWLAGYRLWPNLLSSLIDRLHTNGFALVGRHSSRRLNHRWFMFHRVHFLPVLDCSVAYLVTNKTSTSIIATISMYIFCLISMYIFFFILFSLKSLVSQFSIIFVASSSWPI